jgi:hypothetical protein
MTKEKIVTGFDPKTYAGHAIKEIPLSLIDEPRRVTQLGLRGYRSVKRVRDYAKRLKAGETSPPIELIEARSSDGRLLKKPFAIYNGEHRCAAAVLAGRETMLAVIAWVEEEDADEFAEDEFATNDGDWEKIKIVGCVERGEDEDGYAEWTDEDDDEYEAGLANGTYGNG